ncbi:hypothetical protein COL922a_013014 [Colletotrichum nupharicola]|nr:hypothetical protein COL922a_013014 [Colletotrichum nupharicola]
MEIVDDRVQLLQQTTVLRANSLSQLVDAVLTCTQNVGQIQSSELEQMRAEDYASKMECALASLRVSGICGQLRDIRISDGSPSPAREAEAEHMMT